MPKDTPPENLEGKAVPAAILAWLLPGAGHFYLGRRHRGGLFFLLIMASMVLGERLEGKIHTTFNGILDALATVTSFGSGLAFLVLRFVLGHTGEISAAGYEYGGAFLLTAGLMNLLLVIDCWDIAQGRKV